MIPLHLEPALVEEAVFLEVRRHERSGDGALARDYHAQLNSVYERTEEGTSRDRAFHDIGCDWLARLGLAGLLRDAVDGAPALAGRVEWIALLSAHSAKQEGSELFLDSGRRRAVLWLRPERFLDRSALVRFMERELLRLGDMVDPAFGYRPDLGPAASRAEENLVRDRYALLWETYVSSRVARDNGHADEGAHLAPLYARAFQGTDRGTLDEIRRAVWHACHLSHSDLVEIARAGAAPALQPSAA